jgi:hypothetical protein
MVFNYDWQDLCCCRIDAMKDRKMRRHWRSLKLLSNSMRLSMSLFTNRNYFATGWAFSLCLSLSLTHAHAHPHFLSQSQNKNSLNSDTFMKNLRSVSYFATGWAFSLSLESESWLILLLFHLKVKNKARVGSDTLWRIQDQCSTLQPAGLSRFALSQSHDSPRSQFLNRQKHGK